MLRDPPARRRTRQTTYPTGAQEKKQKKDEKHKSENKKLQEKHSQNTKTQNTQAKVHLNLSETSKFSKHLETVFNPVAW